VTLLYYAYVGAAVNDLPLRFHDNFWEQRDHNTAVLILPRTELDQANVDRKHYPDDFEVHLVLSKVGGKSKSINLDGDNWSLESATDLSDTDEDEWERPFEEV